MASADFGIPTELNPGVDRSPAAPAVTRRIYIPPSNNTTFQAGGDIQFRLPTAEPGSMLDSKYTYMKFSLQVDITGKDSNTFTDAKPGPVASAYTTSEGEGWYLSANDAANNPIGVGGTLTDANSNVNGTAFYKRVVHKPIPAVYRFPSCGGSSIFDRLEIYQGGVPVEQISYYNIIAKKFFQSEAGDSADAAWKQGWYLGTGMGAGSGSAEGYSEGGCAYGGDGTVPSSKFQQMSGQYRAFTVDASTGVAYGDTITNGWSTDGVTSNELDLTYISYSGHDTGNTLPANFEFCVPILSGLVGLWSEKFLPLMLLGVSSFYLNFKLADVQSILEPITNTMSSSGIEPTGTGNHNVGIDVCEADSLDLWGITSVVNTIASYAVTKVELVCTQVLLLPSVTQLLYANANQNSISWTTTSRRDYPQIMSSYAGGWTMAQNNYHPIWDGSLIQGTQLDLIVPCRLQSVRSFDLIMTYIGSEAMPGADPGENAQATLVVNQEDRLFFLNPVYKSLQFKKGSEYFPQRPMTLNGTMDSWIPGVSPELTAESLIGEDGWFPFNQKESSSYMQDSWRGSHIAPWTRQMGAFVYTHDCRTFRGVDASTRSGISFEKEQFNIVMTIAPLGTSNSLLPNVAQAVYNTGSMVMNQINLANYRFHFIPVYDMMVTITPTGSMEVAY